jgi:hypothetical protein
LMVSVPSARISVGVSVGGLLVNVGLGVSDGRLVGETASVGVGVGSAGLQEVKRSTSIKTRSEVLFIGMIVA